MNKDKLIHEIGAKIVSDISSQAENWSHLVLVGTMENDSPRMTGFAYDESGKHGPVSPDDFDILDLLVELRDAMAATDRKRPWRACLLRISRDTGEISIDFDYNDPDRWAINFGNAATRARELRPLKG